MKHVNTITRMPNPAQGGDLGDLSPIESVIVLVLSTVFEGWDNLQPAISNLTKYYSKTPD